MLFSDDDDDDDDEGALGVAGRWGLLSDTTDGRTTPTTTDRS